MNVSTILMRDQLKTILIVDDEEDFLFSVKTVLDVFKKDCEIVTIDSCEKCIDLMDTEMTPDVIILDIAFPGMDGFTLFEKIQHHDRWKDTPIIFTTAWGDNTRRQQVNKLKCDFIEKPFTNDDILYFLNKHLKK